MCHPTYLLFVSLNDLPRNIVPYIQKFGRNPVTGKPLALKDLIKLTFHKNADGRSKANVSLPAQGIQIELYPTRGPRVGRVGILRLIVAVNRLLALATFLFFLRRLHSTLLRH